MNEIPACFLGASGRITSYNVCYTKLLRTTLGQYADWIFLLVRTDPDAPKKQAGISFILVEMNSYNFV